jgi:hypothetical protein
MSKTMTFSDRKVTDGVTAIRFQNFRDALRQPVVASA